ncbi:MAG TPA: O-antigen ligase family protein [Phototrophicaceae bacterium]|nr:O-antigen ligase family protein [Phototrophicaceae bacterium]
MRKPSEFIVRTVVILLCSFFLTTGATFNSLLSPELSATTLVFMAVVVVCWLVLRWRRGWQWHRTPLDAAFILWAAAFGLSLLANWDAGRRIAIGLWYVGVYIGLWYILMDALANSGIQREMLVDGLLVSGVVVLLFGYLQLINWVGVHGFNPLPRPVSVFGNPNFLSAFLIVLILFLLSQMVGSRRRFNQIVLGGYAGLALALLFLTFSRGAWVGLAAGGVLWLALVLAARGLLSGERLLVGLATTGRIAKVVILIGGLSTIVVLAAVSGIFVRSLTTGGRDVGLRTELYTAAVQLFVEKPLTGHGLFTYGRELVRLPGIVPDRPHSHAHDAPLHIAAELGIVGLVALAVTVAVMARGMRGNWRQSPYPPPLRWRVRERGETSSLGLTGNTFGNRAEIERQTMLAGAVGAVAAFAVHQLTDTPAMMPAIALTGLIALVLALAPMEPQPIQAAWRRMGQPVGLIGLWLIILVAGFWSSGIYRQYMAVLQEVGKTGDYHVAAENLQSVIEADPYLSLYHLEQGFLYGMAASTDDTEAAQKAIKAYERFIELDPGYALAWANLGALRWQVGEREQAIADMSHAAELDPESWQYAMNVGMFVERTGDVAAACTVYKKALETFPDAALYAQWRETDLGRSILGEDTKCWWEEVAWGQLPSIYDFKLTIPARVALLLQAGNVEEAKMVWEQTAQPFAVPYNMIRLLLALADGDRETALKWQVEIERLAVTNTDQAWVHLGRARILRSNGDEVGAEKELDTARELLHREPLANDDEDALNIAYAQFLRQAIPRWLLPQVYYPVDSPVLLFLIENT